MGLPHLIQRVEEDFEKALKNAEIRPEVRLYDLRHTMASLFLA
ncbi:MAG: hypothetical protein ACREN8_09240 [Candidatus Dormibacteraceae bacterium]